jgi:D-glycero-alpha-D-manno-heptose-7-phosphate kinase
MPDYCKHHTGAVINTTIRLFTHTSLELRDDTKVTFKWINKDEFEEHDFGSDLDCSYGLKLFKATHNHICKRYNIEPIGYDIVSNQDVPTGSGLGTSSTLIVSLIGVYMELFNLPLGEYDIAEMAIQIERVELGENGGKQDQYAAAFGGFNYMEFKGDDVMSFPKGALNMGGDMSELIRVVKDALTRPAVAYIPEGREAFSKQIATSAVQGSYKAA